MVFKQIFMYTLILTRFFMSFSGPYTFKTSIPEFFYIYMVFTFLIYWIVEKMQKRITRFLTNSINNNSLKINFNIIFFTFIFLQYMSVIMLCIDKIWLGNLVYAILFNVIIYFHLKELSNSFKPKFHSEFFISILVKNLSFFTISGFVFCFNKNNQSLERLNVIICLSYITLFVFSVNVVNAKIKCFREDTEFFYYNKYINVALTDGIYFILSVSLITIISTHENFGNIVSKEQNGYEFIAFFCCMLNVAYSFFGLFFTIIDCIGISMKIKKRVIELQKIMDDVVIIVSPSDNKLGFDINLGNKLSLKEPTPPNEVATQSLSEVEVV